MARRGMSFDRQRLQANLTAFDHKVNNAIGAAFEYQAPKSEARMKVTAPWHDNTTNARSSLFTKPSHSGTHHELLLSHGVSYGIYLEHRFSGRYATVTPEIIRAAVDIRRLINKLIDKLPRG